MAPDVTTNLYGGLGNQLFEYAATLHALREVGGSTFELVNIEPEYDPDITALLDVPVRPLNRIDRATNPELAELPGPARPVFRRTARLASRRDDYQSVDQWYFPFTPAVPLARGRRVRLNGFFQHPTWFQSDWSTVASQILQRAPGGFADLVDQRRTVISLRQRADYVQAQWTLPIEHYDRLLDELIAGGAQEVVVVADEPTFIPWFRRYAEHRGLRVLDVEPLTGQRTMDDFWNLAAADSLAIANSTFSWWGAAVATADRPGTRVHFPRPWFGNRWTGTPLPSLGLETWAAVPSFLPEVE